MFDPDALPVPDLGLRCMVCEYDLRGAPEHRCPECGRPFTLDDYLGAGAYPQLFVEGKLIRPDADVVELLKRYDIPHSGALNDMDTALGFQTSVTQRPVITVLRDYYWDAVDLIIRHRRGLPLPEVPEQVPVGPDWRCQQCGEENPGHFDICWQCEAVRGGDQSTG